MKKWKWSKIVGVFGLLLLPALLWVGAAKAQSFRTGDNTTVGADEVVDSSLYAAGRTVDIAGEVNGDVFCAGQNVTISGLVRGDVICAGQTVHISGRVTGDVRVAGQTVTVAAVIDGNLSAGSQSFSLSGDSRIGQDATVGGNDVVLNGAVGRDLIAGGNTVTLANSVGRHVTARTDDLTLRNGTRIAGTLTYTSTKEAVVSDNAQIAGRTTWNKRIAKEESKGNYGQVFAFGLSMALFVIAALLATALVLVLLVPSVFHHSTGRALANPLKTFLTGLLASLAMPVLIIGLMMTVIGLPLGFLALLIWLLILILSGPFFGYFVGRVILKRQRNPVAIGLVGSLVIIVAHFIPILGVVAFLATLWFGTGIILREIYHRTPKPKYDLK